MTEVHEKLQDIRAVQASIDTLLSEQSITVSTDESPGTWSIEEVYTGEECNFGFAYSDADGKASFPEHVHTGSVEYLICVKGRVLLDMNDKVTRVLNVGDCASIPPGIPHNTKPLEPASKLVYVCVPPDETFPQRKAR